MITEKLSTLKIHKLSKRQYERELAAGHIDENALYLTPDDSIDDTLTISGQAADAKAVGDKFNTLTLTQNNYGSELPETGVEGQLFLVEDTEPTDSTLTIEGAAADAKAVGDALGTKANLINIGTYVGDINSLDIPLNSVAWCEKDTCTNAPTSTAFYMETWGSQANVRFQRCISTEGTTCQRMYFNSAWTEWDWFNPWQANGSEARTAERWNGHVVYTRNVACGALVSGRKLVELPELAKCVVLDACGYINQGSNNFTMIPSIYSQDLKQSTSVSLLVNTQGNIGYIQLWGGSSLVGKNAFVQLKYFKL